MFGAKKHRTVWSDIRNRCRDSWPSPAHISTLGQVVVALRTNPTAYSTLATVKSISEGHRCPSIMSPSVFKINFRQITTSKLSSTCGTGIWEIQASIGSRSLGFILDHTNRLEPNLTCIAWLKQKQTLMFVIRQVCISAEQHPVRVSKKATAGWVFFSGFSVKVRLGTPNPGTNSGGGCAMEPSKISYRNLSRGDHPTCE